MKFGKEFTAHLEETLPEWRDKFLCYKALKKLLKHFPNSTASMPIDHLLNLFPPHQQPQVDGSDRLPPTLVDLQDWFVRILNEELAKFNEFFVDKEEDFIIRFQELKQRIEQVREQSSRDGILTSDSEFSQEMMEIRRDFVSIHGEMVLLKNYSSLNFTGLIKILKKYDKRTGELLQVPFTQLAVRQPFFTTEYLTRLVRECEANLELLFPIVAEVIQSSSAAPQEGSSAKMVPPRTVSNLGEETMDLYRSTRAAMNAIMSLQRESSTNNPLSYSSLFRSQERDDSSGAITDEKSGLNSSAEEEDEEEEGDDEEDDARSL